MSEPSPCPRTPNCVCSIPHDSYPRALISPLTYEGPPGQAMERLVEILDACPGITLQRKEATYLLATAKTRLFGFTDDIEFFFQEQGVIHLRSASRVGYWDLGTNRRRLERIRRRFMATQQSTTV